MTNNNDWNFNLSECPKGIPVIVDGGLAMRKTGDEWFSGMEEPLYKIKLQWAPTAWMHLPAPPTTKGDE